MYRPRVLVTAPQQYASRLCARLVDAGMRPLWNPGVHTGPLPSGSALERHLDERVAPLLLRRRPAAGAAVALVEEPPPHYDFVAFTSRAGVEAVMGSLARQLGKQQQQQPSAASAAGAALAGSGAVVCALGADADLLKSTYGVETDVNPVEDASTMGLVRALARREEEAAGKDRPRRRRRPRVLCPVPRVSQGLVEPSVVPRFLAALEHEAGLDPVRVDAYLTVPGLLEGGEEEEGGEATAATAAAGQLCAAEREMLARGDVDAVAFSSTAEAQGLALQLYWAAGAKKNEDEGDDQQLSLAAASFRALLSDARAARAARGQPPIVLAAHGPTTAAGVADALGLDASLDPIVVSRDWSSFAGVTEALREVLVDGRSDGGGGGRAS
jgi:uroporphyrinogen-III synthase